MHLVDSAQLPAAVAAEIVTVRHRHHNAGIVAPLALHASLGAAIAAAGLTMVDRVHALGHDDVPVFTPEAAKGLEFDGVVVVNPHQIFDGAERGAPPPLRRHDPRRPGPLLRHRCLRCRRHSADLRVGLAQGGGRPRRHARERNATVAIQSASGSGSRSGLMSRADLAIGSEEVPRAVVVAVICSSHDCRGRLRIAASASCRSPEVCEAVTAQEMWSDSQ